MKQIKIIREAYDVTNGDALTEILTPYGRFKGEARFNPADAYMSKLLGTEIAYVRAVVNMYAYRLKLAKKMLREINILIERCQQMRNFNPKSAEFKVLLTEKKRLTAEVEDITNLIDAINKYLHEKIALRCERANSHKAK